MRRLVAVAVAVAATTGGGYALGAGAAPTQRAAEAAERRARAAAVRADYPETFAKARQRGVDNGFTDGAVDGRVRGNIRGRAAGERAVQKEVDKLAKRVGHAEQEVQIDTSQLSGSVLVVGDSLEVLTSPYLKRHLPGVDLGVSAKGGYNSIQLFGLFNRAYDPAQDVIVFDAGTNDNPNYPQILQGNLARVANIVGDRCMVVPTIHGLRVDGVGDAGKNRVVQAFAASRPGTQVPDWRGFVATHPEAMQPDNLHPNPAGADARARLIAEGIRGCLQFEASFGLGQ
jgi:hypothetical protein